MSDSEGSLDQRLEESEAYLQDLEELRDFSKERGWQLFQELILDFLAEQMGRELETAKEEIRVRQLQGGIRFYREILDTLKNMTSEAEVEKLKEDIEEMRHGEEDS